MWTGGLPHLSGVPHLPNSITPPQALTYILRICLDSAVVWRNECCHAITFPRFNSPQQMVNVNYFLFLPIFHLPFSFNTIFRMVFERLARFKVTFTTLSMDVLATEKCFAGVAT